ncbi:MAG: M48 family metalloprotease [Chitinophagaceae bacterium]
MPKLFIPLLLVLTVGINHLNAQTEIYQFQDLSHFYYAKQKDSIRKAWDCPATYSRKETQKKYREIWDERTSFITDAIASDNYIYQPVVYQLVAGIVDQIVKANPGTIKQRPLLLIDRSASVNAYAVGGNIMAVNLGLIVFSESREELALAIAHEISHNLLSHPENAMKQRAEWLTSDDYNESVNAVLDSKYERLSRLKKVLEGFSFSRSKHQRYKESEADSLAIQLLKNSGISFQADFFLRLDSSDNNYQEPLKQPVQAYFTSYQLPFEAVWTSKKSRGLSTRNYNFNSGKTGLQDSLKTHPDCVQRYNQTLNQSDKNAKLTPVPDNIKAAANRMLIWNMFYKSNLTPCLYRVLLEKDKGNTDQWYDFMMHNIFTALNFADREMHRFSAIGVVPKEYISKDYYELQTMLEQIPRESLELYCQVLQKAPFWTGLSSSEKGMKQFMYTLALDPDPSDKNRSRVAKNFVTSHSASMYCELAGDFNKK